VIRSFNGKSPRIHPTAFVSELAYVVGDVEIGAHSSIWPGAVIRGDSHKITIGESVNIQDNCVIHADSDAHYGDFVTLGHRVMCHAKTVGTNTLIGNGAVVNGDAEIGEYSIVASGAVVLDRAVIPPRSFVAGVPAEVLRESQERHHKLAHGTAAGYAKTGQAFREQGLGDVPEEFLIKE
jgi:carbonic anhydrase/acetyltransferase-like protein (isoleucine patch superfamily)